MLKNKKVNIAKKTDVGRPISCKICKHKFYKTDLQKKYWKKNKYSCPSCKSTYCCFPPTEKELMTLQDQFFQSNRDSKYLGKMYEVLIPYSKSLAFKNWGKLMDEENHFEYVHTAIYHLIVSYLKRSDFRISSSFANYVKKRFLQVEIPELTKNISINDKKGNDEEFIQIEAPSNIKTEIEFLSENIEVLDKINTYLLGIKGKYKLRDYLILYNYLSQNNHTNIFTIGEQKSKDILNTILYDIRELCKT